MTKKNVTNDWKTLTIIFNLVGTTNEAFQRVGEKTAAANEALKI